MVQGAGGNFLKAAAFVGARPPLGQVAKRRGAAAAGPVCGAGTNCDRKESRSDPDILLGPLGCIVLESLLSLLFLFRVEQLLFTKRQEKQNPRQFLTGEIAATDSSGETKVLSNEIFFRSFSTPKNLSEITHPDKKRSAAHVRSLVVFHVECFLNQTVRRPWGWTPVPGTAITVPVNSHGI
jgi:hypothetical protein